MPVSETTPPNPYLSHVSERDIATPSGRKLTLLNPAYMLRQVQERYASIFGAHRHITSRKLLRPENRADEWETRSLKAFESGVKEVIEVADREGEPHLRLMRPLVAQEGCLKCHGFQGYEVGDIRGGVSVSVPLAPFLAIEQADVSSAGRTHAVAFLVGLLAILGAALLGRGSVLERAAADRALRELNAELEQRVDQRESELRLAEEEKIEMAARAMKAEKLESLGRLAGGVAHDFNNLLGSIMGYGELVAESLDPDSSAAGDLREVLTAAHSGARLTGRLLAMTSQQAAVSPLVNADELLKEPAAFLGRLLGRDIAVDVDAGQDLWPVRFDPGQFERVLMHLAVNARDAMPEGGKLTVTAKNVTLEEQKCLDCHERLSGDWVVLTIADTGVGIPENLLHRVFEPFFTTKSTGAGSGLGLSTVRGIVSQHKGHIWAESEMGKGTTFTICLPRAREEAQVVTDVKTDRPAKGGRETILLAEDEPPLRRLAARILKAAGYEVIEAEDGQSAVWASKKHAGRIDLFLTDVVMPNMKGPEAYSEIAASRPDVAVVYMSGYTADSIGHDGILEEGVALIGKPFRKAQMLRKIREALDGAVGPGAGVVRPSVHKAEVPPDPTSEPLPAPLKDKLVALAQDGDATALRELLESLVRPDHPALAKRLEAFLQEYDYQSIIDCVG